MFRWTLIGMLLVAMPFAAGLVQTSADAPASGNGSGVTAAEKLESLAWMAGTWVRSGDTDRLEESWSGPAGDSLVGSLRWIKDGKLWMCELILITVEGDDVIFRLRHFDRKLTPWEPDDAPLTYRLIESGERRAVFENPHAAEMRRFVYSRPDERTLLVSLQADQDGRLVESAQFRFEKH